MNKRKPHLPRLNLPGRVYQSPDRQNLPTPRFLYRGVLPLDLRDLSKSIEISPRQSLLTNLDSELGQAILDR
jgi:hypothetical protein